MAFAKLFFDNEHDFDKVLASRLNPFMAGLQQATGVLHEVAGGLHPRFDVVQDNEKVTILAELPGLSKSDISISLLNDRLTIAGTTSPPALYTTEKAKLTYSERTFGRFERTLQIPRGLKAEDVKASMENGVLKLEMPVKTKDQESRKIEIA